MRILVAMSGGVDSSVVAALLKEEGHEVIGATLQLYDHGEVTRSGTCCAGRDILDARNVADKLGIPHYVIDAEERFKQTVIDRFAQSYARGETPVPCVSCNQGVKFTDLLEMARSLGCEAMATGHYVRRVERHSRVELHRPRDQERDQSWFLFATTQHQLNYLRFPLGEVENKLAVRQAAERFGLTIASKQDSQDLCFVPSGSYAELVERLTPQVSGPGEIVDDAGEILGYHRGIAHYTVGQSRRLGAVQGAGVDRRVVKAIEPSTRRIIVGRRDSVGLKTFHLRDMNWLVDIPPDGLECSVQLRAREPVRAAVIQPNVTGGAIVELQEAAVAAPGQACVMYAQSRILGGGYILSGQSS